jgi:tRNA threonylcarbamoyladenosine biosynthesis protein TsaB
MLILAFESSAKAASVAVTNDERLLALYTVDNGLTQSELLMPMAENILKSLHLSFSDVELLATTAGPGSFTGVRIGTSLIKGMALARNIPCSAVSTIEALAKNAEGLTGIIVPVMDARRSQVYTAIFRSDGKEIKRLTDDEALPLSILADRLKELNDEPIYLVGDGYTLSHKALTELGVNLQKTPPLLITENAYSVAMIALMQHRRGESLTDREIKPTYLRLPQAERERLERLQNENKIDGDIKNG